LSGAKVDDLNLARRQRPRGLRPLRLLRFYKVRLDQQDGADRRGAGSRQLRLQASLAPRRLSLSKVDLEDADRSEPHLQVRLPLLRVEAAWKEGNGPMSSQAPELHLLVRLPVKPGVDGKEARALMSNNLAELPLLVPLPAKCRVDGKEARVLTPNPAVLRAADLLLANNLGRVNHKAARKRARKLLQVLALNKPKLASEKRRPRSDPGSLCVQISTFRRINNPTL